MSSSINTPKGIKTLQPDSPEISKYFNIANTPYIDVAQVISEVPLGIRHRGLTVNINGIEYWFKNGKEDADLVIKSVDLINYVPYTEATEDVNLGQKDLKAGQLWLWDPSALDAESNPGDYGRVYIEDDAFHVIGGNPALTHNLFYTSSQGYTRFKFQSYDLQLDATLLTDSRSWQYPDKDGVFALIEDIEAATITHTSQLINDGDNGISHFISLEDLPSNLVLYATNVASGINGYYKLVTSVTDTDYPSTAIDIPTGVITTTNQFIAGLITVPNLIVGNPGIFNITTIGNITKISGSGNAEFFFRVYKRTSVGVETLITTSNVTLPVTNSGYSEFSASALWNDGVFSSTDRIVLKFYANRIPTASNPSYQFQFGGASPVRTAVPIPLNVIPTLKLDDLQDVNATSPSSGSLLYWNSVNWATNTLVGILGYTPKPQRRSTFNNVNYTILSTDVYVGQIGTLTGQVTVTLPAANSVAAGYEIIIADDSGTVTSTNSILIIRSGSDLIVGTTSVTISAAFGMRRLFSDGVSKWSYDVGALRASNNLSDVASATTALSNLGGIPLQTPQTSGVALSFAVDSIYGTISSPEVGNISFNTTNAKLGVTNIIIHNNSTAPTFAANMKRLSGSSSYVVNTINYIYVTYISSTEVIYSINQRT